MRGIFCTVGVVRVCVCVRSYSIVLYAHRFCTITHQYTHTRFTQERQRAGFLPRLGRMGTRRLKLKHKQWKWFSFRFLGEGKQASKLKHIYTETFIIAKKYAKKKTEKVAPPFRAKSRKNQHSHTHVFIIIFCIYEASRKNAPHPPLRYTLKQNYTNTNETERT